MPRKKPNILLIALESTRFDHLSCYGYQRPTTPNIDQVAAEGVLYERAISPAPWTLPSHACLFTGLHTSQHGTNFNNPRLNPDLMTLAETLAAHGYRTGAFSTNPWINETLNFNKGFDTFRWAKRAFEWLAPIFPRETILEKVVRYVQDYWRPPSLRNNVLIEKWVKEAQASDQPFFAYTMYYDPHYPLRPRPPYAKQYLGEKYGRWLRVNKDPDRYMAGAVQMTEEDFEILRGLYDSRIASMDDIIGRLVKSLRGMGILDDTMLILIADHGENFGEHNLMSHQYCVYDTLVHVPLIIRYPARFPTGLRVQGQVQSTELFTTILDVAGIDRQAVKNDLRGRSLVPDELAVAPPLPYAISEYLVPNLERMQRLFAKYNWQQYDRAVRSLRREDYKYIWTSDDRPELYDLKADPGETNNLAAAQPELAAEMQGQMDEWLASINQSDRSAQPVQELSEDVLERLKDLGYL
ncbi:MAG: sulfatase [Chloroflexota bacterium]